MNNSTCEKEIPRKFKLDIGRSITYGFPVFLLFHILGLFIPSFDWIWHFPTLVSGLAALVIGFIMHWLVFTYKPAAKKDES